MNFLNALLLSLIEGITEFLPVSSTGHMVLFSGFFGNEENPFVKNFEVIIQLGAILSVVVLYRKRFFQWNTEFYKKILFAFFPTAVIGFLLKKSVDVWLGNVQLVAWALILGGVILIWSDRKFSSSISQGKKIQDLSWMQCLILGVCQSFALVPGVSRSGATIVGGLGLGLSQKEAAEFSFFLAVPTMLAATGYKLVNILPTITSDQIQILLFGSVISFFVAMIAVKSFITWISQNGFKAFGYYRILLGTLILVLIYNGTGVQN